MALPDRKYIQYRDRERHTDGERGGVGGDVKVQHRIK